MIKVGLDGIWDHQIQQNLPVSIPPHTKDLIPSQLIFFHLNFDIPDLVSLWIKCVFNSATDRKRFCITFTQNLARKIEEIKFSFSEILEVSGPFPDIDLMMSRSDTVIFFLPISSVHIEITSETHIPCIY